MTQLAIPANDYGEDVPFVIQKPDGTAKDLTGLTATLKVWKNDPATVIFSKTLTITDAVNGKCKWPVVSADMATLVPSGLTNVETYHAEVELTSGSVRLSTTTEFDLTIKASP